MSQLDNKPKTLIPLAAGCEDMEVVIVADILRRAGCPLVLAGVAGMEPVLAAHGTRLLPDAGWADIEPASFQAIVIPGGWDGVLTLERDERVLNAVRDFMTAGKWVAAICAGPLVLQAAGILAGRRVTCYPGVADRLTQTVPLADRVIVDGRLVTSQGPGTAMDFALALVRAAIGDAVADRLAADLLATPSGLN